MDEALIARFFQVFLALAGAYLLALWFALVVWTYRDITSRSTNAFTQIFSTLLVVLFFVPGAFIYLILRPRETLDDAFQRSMEEEYLLQDLDDIPICPECRRAIRDDFVFCPHCSAALRHACSTCHRLVDVRWEVCPYCGADQTATVGQEPRDIVSSRSRQRAATAPLQAIDGGRAIPRSEAETRRPVSIHDDLAHDGIRSAGTTSYSDTNSTDEHHVSPTGDAPSASPGDRDRATVRRRDGSGN